MIKPEELRIGNRIIAKFEDTGQWEQCTVLAIDSTGELLDSPLWLEGPSCIGDFLYVDYDGIELTPELLLECGFTYEQFSEATHKYLVLGLPDDEYESKPFFYSKDGKTVQLLTAEDETEIASVDKLHDLQNLYYAIVKAELPIQSKHNQEVRV